MQIASQVPPIKLNYGWNKQFSADRSAMGSTSVIENSEPNFRNAPEAENQTATLPSARLSSRFRWRPAHRTGAACTVFLQYHRRGGGRFGH